VTLTLYVDGDRWRGHLSRTLEAVPGIVPVIKGNGYGFGLERLAAEASKLGADVVAVGEAEEVAPVASTYGVDVLVLAPWRPEFHDAPDNERVIRTVSHIDALRALASGGGRPRVVVEVMTSMRRHGILPEDLGEARPLLDGVQLEGFALHLPMSGDHLSEARALAETATAAVPLTTLWVSHLSPAQVAELGQLLPGVQIRLRSGTALWLGDRGAYRARATVLDVHRLRRGTTYGYRQRKTIRDGTLLVISGGTSHGVALEAPRGATGVRARGKSLALGGLDAAGLVLSPYTVGGKKRWFAEPPHMQVSMVLLPADVVPPGIGDEVDVEVRMTTTTFDRVVIS
jgi:hypothetical protein